MANNSMANLSVQQLQRAITLKEKIDALERELSRVLGGAAAPAPAKAARRKPKISAAGRARIAAAQRARWAKLKGKASAKPARVAKRKLSAAGRARIAAAARARWAKAKAAGKTSLKA